VGGKTDFFGDLPPERGEGGKRTASGRKRGEKGISTRGGRRGGNANGQKGAVVFAVGQEGGGRGFLPDGRKKKKGGRPLEGVCKFLVREGKENNEIAGKGGEGDCGCEKKFLKTAIRGVHNSPTGFA